MSAAAANPFAAGWLATPVDYAAPLRFLPR